MTDTTVAHVQAVETRELEIGLNWRIGAINTILAGVGFVVILR